MTGMNENDMLSIREFAALTGIKQSTLRHYDEVKVFQPVMRGENGYRYYSAPQAVAVNFINVMSSLNIPLKTISEIQKERTPKQMLQLLHKQELNLNRELYRLQQAYAIIHTYCATIQEGLLADEHAISSSWVDAVPISIGPANDFSSGYFFDSLFTFIKKMDDYSLDAAYPIGGYYQDISAFEDKPGQPSNFFCMKPTGREVKGAGEYLIGYARGYYGQLGDLPARMRAYADEAGLMFTGPVYELYLHDEVSMASPDEYLIQASTPVKKKRVVR